MAVDIPATIAVIGAGPIGLEAALYARYLGYDVRVFERGRVVERLQSDSAAALADPWRESGSPLGVRALCAQHPQWQSPAADERLSPADLAELYFLPLAQSDLLVDCIFTDCEVTAIERNIEEGDEAAAEDELTGFRIHVRDTAGERIEKADVVIDASGANSQTWNVEPGTLDFYVLGRKSAGDAYRHVIGLAQIRDLFAIIADRQTLDLYSTMAAG